MLILGLWRRRTSPRGTMTSRTLFKARRSMSLLIGFMESKTSSSSQQITQNTVLQRIQLTVLLELAVKTQEWSAKSSDKSSKKCRLSVMSLPLGNKTVTSIQLMVKTTALCPSIKTQSAAKSCRLRTANLLQVKAVMKISSLRQECTGAQPRLLTKSWSKEFHKETILLPDLWLSTLRLLRERIPTWVRLQAQILSPVLAV